LNLSDLNPCVFANQFCEVVTVMSPPVTWPRAILEVALTGS
jgi:hypothetical protein